MATRTLLFPVGSDPVTSPDHAVQHGSHAGGWIGYAEVTANQGSITAEVDLTSLTVAVTAGTGRRIRISAQALFSSSVAGDRVAFRIKEGGTTLMTGQLVPVGDETFPFSVVIAPTPGAHTYKLTAQRLSGTGNVSMNAGADAPAFILVEDIGAV